MSEQPKCQLCGEPMPEGEEMFNYHGYSGPCPKKLSAEEIADIKSGLADIAAGRVKPLSQIRSDLEPVQAEQKPSDWATEFVARILTFARTRPITEDASHFTQELMAALGQVQAEPAPQDSVRKALQRLLREYDAATEEGFHERWIDAIEEAKTALAGLPLSPLEANRRWFEKLAEPAGKLTGQGAESLARRFHETYERLAPQFGYETRKESAVPWEHVPERNRKLMIAVCVELAARPAGVTRNDPRNANGIEPLDEPEPAGAGQGEEWTSEMIEAQEKRWPATRAADAGERSDFERGFVRGSRLQARADGEVRRLALEEAAQACEKFTSSTVVNLDLAAKYCAETIRALAAPASPAPTEVRK